MRNPFKAKPKKANPDVVKIKEGFQIIEIAGRYGGRPWISFGDANKFIDYAKSEGQERIFYYDENYKNFILFFFYVNRVCISIELKALVDE